MTPSIRGLAVAAGVAVASALAAAPAHAATNNSFYLPPATLPAENGKLIKTYAQKLGVSFGLPFLPTYLPGKATRIQYKSTDANGNPVAVSGLYIEPTKGWTGPGKRPLVAYAEGTQGQADACAPSKTLENTLNYQNGSIGVGYEVPSIYGLLNRGLAVVVTDYIGLGDPTRIHTYVDRVDMAHAVLDAARAALQVPGASVTAESPVGTYGYSQGGGASAAALELASSYAPDVNLKAGYAGAPPANLLEVLKTADGTSLTGVLGYAINGLVANNPELGPILAAKTNNAGKAALAKVSNQCIGESLASFAYKKTNEWTTSKLSAYTVVSGMPDVLAVVDKQRIGKIKPTVPVQIVSGTKDDIVGHLQARQLAADWCRLGAQVRWAPVSQPLGSGGSSLNHLGPMLTNLDSSQIWLRDRLIGKAGGTNCYAVPGATG